MMWPLVLSGVRRRLAALSAIFMAAMLGAALVLLSGSLFETGIRLAAPPKRLTSAPIVLIGEPSYRMLDERGRPTTDYRPYPERHRLDPAVIGTTARIDGVAAGVPVFLLSVAGPTGTLTGQNWTSAALGPFALTEGGKPAADDEIVVTPALARRLRTAPGDTVRLADATYRVAGIAGDPDSPVTLFFTDTRATALSGDGRPDAVAVLPDPGADIDRITARIAASADGVRVLTGDQRGAAEDPAVAASRTSTIVIGAVFGGIVLVVLATVVSALISLSVRQRSREISLLRASGATGRQARRLIVAETMIVSLAGVLTGLVLGVPLTTLVFTLLTGNGIVPDMLSLSIGPLPFAVATATTLLVTWTAARVAARPALRARAIDALREADLPSSRVGSSRVGPLRWILGVLFALGTVALAVLTSLMSPALTSATSGPAVLTGSIAVALLAPAVLRAVLPLLRGVARLRAGSLAGLAVHNTRARAAETATVVTSIALVVGIGAGNLVAQSIQLQAQRDASIASIRADLVVQVPGGADEKLIHQVSTVEGVEAASAFVTSGGWIEHPYDPSHRDRPWPVRGVTADAATKVLTTPVVTGSLSGLTGDTIALPQATAETLALAVGDTLTFRFGDGASAPLRLVATYADRSGYETLLLPHRLLAAHTSSRHVPQLLITVHPENPGETRQALLSALAGTPGTTVGDRTAIETVLNQGAGVQGTVNSLMVAITIAYAAIAVVNTLGISILTRRRELALLRLSGATRRQVRTTLTTEILLLTTTGITAGLIVAAAAIIPTTTATSGTLLHPTPILTVLSLLAVVTSLIIPVTLAATHQAMRKTPAETLAIST
ncbi:FtsX-like permease family protein [Sphaerisporangium rubeum]